MFNTIEIDRKKLTIMGIKFSDLNTLENTAKCLKVLYQHLKELKS